jgi:hypothetical protein
MCGTVQRRALVERSGYPLEVGAQAHERGTDKKEFCLLVLEDDAAKLSQQRHASKRQPTRSQYSEVCAAANRTNRRRVAANSDYSRFAITAFPTSEKRRGPSMRSCLLAERIMIISNAERTPRASVQIETTEDRSGEAVVACSEIRSWRSRPEASNCPSSAFVVEQARSSDSAIAAEAGQTRVTRSRDCRVRS